MNIKREPGIILWKRLAILSMIREELPLLEEALLAASRTDDLSPKCAEFVTHIQDEITRVLG